MQSVPAYIQRMTERNANETRGLRFAIVGCGRIAARHAEHIANEGRLVAACDILPDRASRLAEPYGAESFPSIDAMLASGLPIDVVSVCSPNGFHARHSIAALDAGSHVLCEKPMAITVGDCRAMIEAAEQADRRLFIVKQNRFNPPVVAVKKLIDDGRLGRIFSIQLNCFWNRNPDYYQDTWKGTLDLDGGSLFTQFSHFIDLLYWMIGDVAETFAFMDNFAHGDIVEFEDTGAVAIRFANGVIGSINFTTNAYGQNMEGSLAIFAEKGTVKIGGQYLNELEYQSLDGPPIADLPQGNPANSYGHYHGSMSNHNLVYRNVVEVLSNNGVIATSGYEGLKTVEIIDRIYASVRERRALSSIGTNRKGIS
jgi:predicted dehydrogenase